MRSKLCLAEIPQDAKQPWLYAISTMPIEAAQAAYKAFLHRVLSLGGIARQITCHGVDGVQMRERDLAKPPSPLHFRMR